jgi:hypothetical protein
MQNVIKTLTVTVGAHGGCLLPGGITVADADEDTLRKHCKALLGKSYDARLGRQELEAAYGAKYAKISELGATAAITEWFEQNEGN